MNDQTCPNCGEEMKWIPAGVSKRTGQPYIGFWSCPNRCPKTNQGDQSYQPKPTQEQSFEKAQGRKDETMRILNSKNGAASIVVALIEKDFILQKDIEKNFANYCTYIYEFEPNANDEIKIENLPF